MKKNCSCLLIILFAFSFISCDNDINMQNTNSHSDFSDLPYLSAVQSSLKFIFNNDDDGYWHTQEQNVCEMYMYSKYPDSIKEINPTMDESEIVEIYSIAARVGNFNAYAELSLKDFPREDSFIKVINDNIKEHGVKNKIIGIEEIEKSKYKDVKDTLKDFYDVDASEVRYIKIFLEADDYYGSNEAEMECYPYLIDNQWYAYFDNLSFI